MKRALVVAAIIGCIPLSADVQYYSTDRLTSIDASRWTVVGTPAASAAGLSIPSANGGSLISKAKIPDGSSEVEIRATLTLTQSGGVYTEFVQASPDSHTANKGAGSYLAFEMQNPKLDIKGNCLANFVLLQSTSGVVSLLASFQHGCRNGMEMRMAVNGGTALVWPDQANPIEFAIAETSGQPGIGGYSMPPGNSISQVELGSISRGKPPMVDSHIGTSAFRTRTDVQWQPAVHGPSTAGSAGYFVYRDGAYFLRTTETHFSDEAVSPGAKHTYTIYAIDQHYNLGPGASVTVTTPGPGK